MALKIAKIFVFLCSILPTLALFASFIMLPILVGIVSDRNALLEIDSIIRISAFLVFLITLTGYIGYIFQSKDMRLSGKKGLWVSVLILGNIISIPVFWYLYIFHKPKKAI